MLDVWTDAAPHNQEGKSWFQKNMLYIIIGSSGLALLLLITTIIVFCVCCRHKKSRRGKANRKLKAKTHHGNGEIDVTLASNRRNERPAQPAQLHEDSSTQATDRAKKQIRSVRAIPLPINHAEKQNEEEGTAKELRHTPPDLPANQDELDTTQGSGVGPQAVPTFVPAIDGSKKANSSIRAHSKKSHTKKDHSNKDKDGSDSNASDCSCSDEEASTKPAKKHDPNSKDSTYALKE